MNSRQPESQEGFSDNVVEFPSKEPLIIQYDIGETVNPAFADMFVMPMLQSTIMNLTVLTVFFTNEQDDDLADLCKFLAMELQKEGKKRI